MLILKWKDYDGEEIAEFKGHSFHLSLYRNNMIMLEVIRKDRRVKPIAGEIQSNNKQKLKEIAEFIAKGLI